jgi:hypothetical protein
MNSDLADLRSVCTCNTRAILVGWIVRENDKGQALVDFPGNQVGPLEARSVIRDIPRHEAKGRIPVLLVFENGDPTLPIIVGEICDRPFSSTERTVALCTGQAPDVLVDAEKIVFHAQREIVLRCGRSSVAITSDGKIVIRGTEITSRASRTHKIKGGSVRIN